MSANMETDRLRWRIESLERQLYQLKQETERAHRRIGQLEDTIAGWPQRGDV